jgi:long-subunit fatty acid transport protein
MAVMKTKKIENGNGMSAPRPGRKAVGGAWAAMLVAAGLGTAEAQISAELVSLGKKTGVGARAVSMGEAFTAVADDYSALYYNAAGMTQLTRSEVGVNLSYGMFRNLAYVDNEGPDKRSLESTKLNAFNMVLTDGGRWALGIGYYSPVTFDDPLYFNANGRTYIYDAEGRMDHYRLGLAYMVNEDVRLGLAASSVGGEEQLEIQDQGTVRYMEEYTGYNLEPSFLIHLSDQFSVGGSAVVMERLELTDTYQEKGDDPQESFYDIHHPFQAKMGLAFQSGLTQISADWHGDFWSSYSYSSAGDAFVNHDVHYPNKHTFNLGLEQHLDRRGPVLRAGYTWENQDDERPQPNQRDPFRVSAGVGFMPSSHVGLDFTYQYGGSRTLQSTLPGGPEDLRIDSEDHLVMASLRYRW